MSLLLKNEKSNTVILFYFILKLGKINRNKHITHKRSLLTQKQLIIYPEFLYQKYIDSKLHTVLKY